MSSPRCRFLTLHPASFRPAGATTTAATITTQKADNVNLKLEFLITNSSIGTSRHDEGSMSFFKFKLDNAPVRSTPVPIAASCTSLPSAPQSHLKRSSSSLYASGQKSDTQLELREGQPTLVAEPDARLSLNDGRPRKRLAPVTPAVDSSFSPGSRKLDETWTSMFCFECKASKTRCEEGALGPGDVCSRCLRLSRQYFSDAEPASLASPVAKSPAVPSAKPPAKSGASKRPNGAVVPGETPVTRRQSTPEMFRSMEAEASSAFLSGLTNQLSKLCLHRNVVTKRKVKQKLT